MLASSGEINAPCPVPLSLSHNPTFQHARLEPFLDKADDALIADPVFQEPNEPFLAHGVEERPDIGVEDEVNLPALECDHERIACIVRPAAGPEPVAEPEEVFLVDGIQHDSGRSLDDFVLKAATASGRCRPSGLGMYIRRD